MAGLKKATYLEIKTAAITQNLREQFLLTRVPQLRVQIAKEVVLTLMEIILEMLKETISTIKNISNF